MLLYLAKDYDPKNEFVFTDDLEQSELLQWLFFWHGGGAPYQGQVGVSALQIDQRSC